MEALRYHELCKHLLSTGASTVYLEQGDAGLTEDLIEGYVTTFGRGRDLRRFSLRTAEQLTSEMDNIPPDGQYRALVVRDAHKIFTATSTESLLWRIERELTTARLQVVLVGDAPNDRAREWLVERKMYGVVTEPTVEKLGHWASAKTAGRWDYHKVHESALISPEVGMRLMEHVGWSYTAAVQAARSLRVYTSGESVDIPLPWELVSAVVPPKLGFGYADALVFGKGRRAAYTLSEGIVGAQTLKTLGLVRFYLRQFAKLRAVEVERMSDRAVAEETGVHVWHWRTKYKPMYASYTNDRIRMRLGAVEQATRAARAGAPGALEVLAASW